MISLPTNTDIFLFSQPTDMRKSFCGLAGIVRDGLAREPNERQQTLTTLGGIVLRQLGAALTEQEVQDERS